MQIIPNKLYLAMNAAMFIAYKGSEETPVVGSEIVDYSNLNKRALEPVLQKLSGADIIVSVKGARGGYFMPTPCTTTLRDVAEAFITNIVPEKHEFLGYDELINSTLTQCHQNWLKSLSKVTFEKLCENARSSGFLPKVKEGVLYFSI